MRAVFEILSDPSKIFFRAKEDRCIMNQLFVLSVIHDSGDNDTQANIAIIAQQ
jgi:hypothetical protein